MLAHERLEQAVGGVEVRVREAALVAEPGVVHVHRVAREVADDLAAAQVHAEVAAGGAVRADGIADLEVEGPRGEPVRRRRERADRADLHRVPRERRAEVLAGRDADLLVRAGGSVMFSEVTEVRDAIHLLTPRAINEDVSRRCNRPAERALVACTRS